MSYRVDTNSYCGLHAVKTAIHDQTVTQTCLWRQTLCGRRIRFHRENFTEKLRKKSYRVWLPFEATQEKVMQHYKLCLNIYVALIHLPSYYKFEFKLKFVHFPLFSIPVSLKWGGKRKGMKRDKSKGSERWEPPGMVGKWSEQGTEPLVFYKIREKVIMPVNKVIILYSEQ